MVNKFNELTYGSIESKHDLIYLSFFFQDKQTKSEKRVVLDIQENEDGEIDVVNPDYVSKIQDIREAEIIRNNAILKVLSEKIYLNC